MWPHGRRPMRPGEYVFQSAARGEGVRARISPARRVKLCVSCRLPGARGQIPESRPWPLRGSRTVPWQGLCCSVLWLGLFLSWPLPRSLFDSSRSALGQRQRGEGFFKKHLIRVRSPSGALCHLSVYYKQERAVPGWRSKAIKPGSLSGSTKRFGSELPRYEGHVTVWLTCSRCSGCSGWDHAGFRSCKVACVCAKDGQRRRL